MGVIDREHLHVEARSEWRAWLASHHASSPGVWLVSWKASTGRPAVGYDDAVREALCFGWVDSQNRSIDAERSAQLFTPRRSGSGWAGTNKRRIEELEAQGLMTDAGRALVDAAKADGTWTLLDGAEAGTVPEDLATALAAFPTARAAWDGFPEGVRRGMLTWLVTAKRAETRARRVAEIAAEAAEGRRAGQWGR
ncbi:MAG: YdeI/OmpD-associated family protein [Patulibacter minatonensis]